MTASSHGATFLTKTIKRVAASTDFNRFPFCYVISRNRVGSLLPPSGHNLGTTNPTNVRVQLLPPVLSSSAVVKVIQLLEKKSLVELELAVLKKSLMGRKIVK